MGDDRRIDDVASRLTAAIDRFEAAVRRCPDPLWDTSMWLVRRSDPWIWPQPRPDGTVGVDRDDGSIQTFSRCWYVATHAAYFLDLYLEDGTGGPFTPMPPFTNADQELTPDKAAVIPARPHTREEVLAYVAHGRAKAERVLAGITDEVASRVMPEDHPWAGSTFLELLAVNGRHLEEHAGHLVAHAARSHAQDGELEAQRDRAVADPDAPTLF